MADQPLEPIQEEAPAPHEPIAAQSIDTRRDILLWLALLPVILGLLFLCGQVALLFSLRQSAADTRSRLETSYGAWIYDLIPPINIPQLIEDIQEDLRAEGIIEEPAPVVTGVFWVPPTATGTATPVSVAAATFTQQPIIPSATPPPPQPRPTNTNEPPRPTNTIAPSATFTSAPTRTNTFAPPQPTRTNTAPPPEPTRTPVPPTLTPLPPTATRTSPPPPTVPPPPPYEPVSPIAENEGASVPDGNGGCKAYFGYRNNNLYAVNIPIGSRNQVNIENASAPPTSFAVGRIAGAFQITWYGGGSVIWELDGRRAEVGWCNP